MQSGDLILAIQPVVAQLERQGVPYYLGGSVASSVFGYMRTTQDADLVADLRSEHVPELVAALKDRYYLSEAAMRHAIAQRSCFNLIHLATMFKVDVFAMKNRPYDRSSLQRIAKKELAAEDPQQQFFVAAPEDVILAKLEWYRLGDEVSDQQWRDVLGVLEVQQERLDYEYLNNWAAQLGVADLLQRALQERQT